jgi:hypothetical protein
MPPTRQWNLAPTEAFDWGLDFQHALAWRDLSMPNEERERLTGRAEDLRRLFEAITDSRARDAITAEIAKHEALLAEIDNSTASNEIGGAA